MQIIIPMTGVSRRFKEAGYKLPKHLLEIDGKKMIEHVINFFPGEKDFLFVCNKEQLAKTDLKKVLLRAKPTGKIVGVEYSGKGPVYSVLKATRYIKDQESVIVNYCDFNTYWDYAHFKKNVLKNKIDGCVICYKGFHPHLLGSNLYAGVKTDAKNFLVEIREKFSFTENKMDTWQSSGTYYFRSGALVKKYFQQLVAQDINLNGEYYVSLVYNLLKKDGLQTSVYPIKYFCQWGTPQDLQEYLYWSEYFRDKSV